MQFVKNGDYEYIMNKYHAQDKPFNSFSRFIRNDGIFDEATGLSGEEILKGIVERDEQIREEPHAIRKARAFEYILKNTRISCDVRDIFPAINMVDRPLNATIVKQWRNEVFKEIIPEVEKKRAAMEKSGAATIWPDFDHSVPHWERIFGLGFRGLLEHSEKMREERKALTGEETAFYDGVKITYTAILAFVDRLEKQAEKDGNVRLEKALHNIGRKPP